MPLKPEFEEGIRQNDATLICVDDLTMSKGLFQFNEIGAAS